MKLTAKLCAVRYNFSRCGKCPVDWRLTEQYGYWQSQRPPMKCLPLGLIDRLRAKSVNLTLSVAPNSCDALSVALGTLAPVMYARSCV